MATEHRSVTPEVVRRVAELARLRVPTEDLTLWTEQLARIVSYIDQIARIPEVAFGKPPAVPPTPVRPDEPRPGFGLEALAGNAPRRFQDYGVVPRVIGGGE